MLTPFAHLSHTSRTPLAHTPLSHTSRTLFAHLSHSSLSRFPLNYLPIPTPGLCACLLFLVGSIVYFSRSRPKVDPVLAARMGKGSSASKSSTTGLPTGSNVSPQQQPPGQAELPPSVMKPRSIAETILLPDIGPTWPPSRSKQAKAAEGGAGSAWAKAQQGSRLQRGVLWWVGEVE